MSDAILETAQMIEAVRLWAGWGRSWPHRSDERLLEHYGSDLGAKLISQIKSWQADFDSFDTMSANLQDMGRLASERFKRMYPAVPDEIVDVFAWCYTWDWR